MKRLLILSFVALAAIWFHSEADAQRTPSRKPNVAQRKKEKDKEEIPAPETVSLTTKDFVSLAATYYAGPESKETPAIIVVHDWGGDRQGMASLADYLQKELGASVIVPDLRGHGDSTEMSVGEKTLDHAKFKKNEVMSSLADLEACKKFLMKKNNEGLLNIEMLSVIAVGKSAKLAVDWSISDWSWAPTPGGNKQGQDVKLVSLVSPIQRIEGMSIKQSLKAPVISGRGMTPLPLQIMWAHSNNRSLSNAKAIYSVVEKSRKKSGKGSMTMNKIEKSNESPTGMLTQAGRVKCFEKLASEVKKRILENKDLLVWQNRDPKK